MEHMCQNQPLLMVRIIQMIDQNTRIIMFIVIFFEYSQTGVSFGGGALPLLDFSYLELQTIRLKYKSNAVFWRPQNMEGNGSVQQSLIEWHHQ